ncbi:helix-turn-helix transcriptional regulator [Streptomyces hoynatensis]|uniref:helix-turn-helix transcriptional regulator n=1 Tax=Streptomyces hoynatensis TaxID=1141874 RepID=UPI00131A491E|nr:LuxR family transcriptional regulator [Streptomyces hoynatensis]
MPRLPGREREWALLSHLLEAARTGPGRGGALLVEGAAGTGRSRLLHEAATAALGTGFSVAFGAADAYHLALPLHPLTAALGRGGQPPAGDRGRDEGGEEALLEGRVEERLRRGPLLVALDDLQWAHPQAAAALHSLVTRFAARPVVWVLARRTEEPRRPCPAERLFAALRDAGAAEPAPLGPLPSRAVAELAAHRLGAEPEPELLAYAEGADGNPAALLALFDGLREERRTRVADGRARLTPQATEGRPPRRFAALVRRRVADLPPGTRLLLDVASVLGRACVPEDAARMLGKPTAAVLPALQEALASGLMRCEGDVLAFRHELVRQALLATLPAPLRGALHRQAARMLLARQGGVLPAAAHLVHGARRGDARAVSVLCSAATTAAATRPSAALELAQRGLEIAEPGHPVRAELARVAVEALTRSGPLPRAAALAEEALGWVPPGRQAAALRHGLGVALLLGGRPARALAVAEAALRQPGEGRTRELAERLLLVRLHALAALDAEAAAREIRREIQRRGAASPGLLCALARAQWGAGRVGEALRLARAAAEPAPAAAHPASAGAAASASPAGAAGGEDRSPFPPRLALAAMLTWLRETTEATTLLGALAEEAKHAEDAAGDAAWGTAWGTEHAGQAGHFASPGPAGHAAPPAAAGSAAGPGRDARPKAADSAGTADSAGAEGAAAAGGRPVFLGLRTLLGASLALAGGDLDEARGLATAGLAAAAEAGLPQLRPLGLRVLAEVALRRGDLPAAEEQAARLSEALAGECGEAAAGRAAPACAAWLTARIAAARRDAEGLGAALGRLHADPQGLRALLVAEPAAAAWLVRAETERGETERAAETARAAQLLAAASPEVPALLAAAAHARGVRERDQAALRRAAELHRDPWARASAEEDLGALTRGDRAGAVAGLDRALAGYARCGAERDEARVRRRLRRLGIRRRHWTQAERPASGWASLTGTERRVAALVAQGLTNRQVAGQLFLSPHTVGFHLRQIYRKLEVQSRIDLVRRYPGLAEEPRETA